ncbi:SapC family protein [Microbulbifer marinus]|uniref:SapC protein n=1 Tax=Microbulbifer marinus TaxID=658218 RepID=A0A1H3X5E9_9GAMM|nr:SapC family protein [Microbulbifer marinus]SDZ94645.1 SapC protein [Microbulbifer marinus]
MTFERNIVALDSNEHRELRIRPGFEFEHLAGQQLVPLAASELISAANSFPTIFVKDGATGDYRCAGMLGVEEGENVVFTNGQGNSAYIPLDIRRYPFYIAGNGDTGEMTLCINELSKKFSRDFGQPLFDEDGNPSQVVNSMKKLLSEHARNEAETRVFVEFLDSKNLLEQRELMFKVDGKDRKISGIFCVSEQAVRDLDEASVLEMHQRNYFGAVYAHLVSLGQVRRILELKAKQGG